jgi:predicted dehydrogenase
VIFIIFLITQSSSFPYCKSPNFRLSLRMQAQSSTGINWGIIGVGDVTEVKSGPAFSRVSDSSLSCVMRRDLEKVKDYALRHNVDSFYTDAQEMLDSGKANAVYIATPPHVHTSYAKQCIESGIDKVYIEKPLALTSQEAKDLQSFVQTYGRTHNRDIRVVVAHYRRSLEYFKEISSMFPLIGNIRSVSLKTLQSPKKNILVNTEDNWRVNSAISGGGYFHDLSPHQLDIMIHWFGKVKSSSGCSATQGDGACDDIVVGNILFENGVVFSGTWCFTVHESDIKDECIIYGDKGHIRFGFFGETKITVDTIEKANVMIIEPPEHIQQPMITHMVEYFLDKREDNPCSLEEAVTVMEIIDSFITPESERVQYTYGSSDKQTKSNAREEHRENKRLKL